MNNRVSFVRRSATLAVAWLIIGCDRQHAITGVAVPAAPARQSAAAAADKVDEPGEADLLELGREIPGFGGMFLDEGGNTVALLTQLRGRSDAEKTAARGKLQVFRDAHRSITRGRNASAPGVVFRDAAYDIVQLAHWRDTATAPILGEPGARWIDLDEAHNRITIGVDRGKEGSVSPAVARKVAELGIPAGAVAIELTDLQLSPSVSDVETDYSGTTLRSYRRPLMGGMAINVNGPSGGRCTLGFNGVLYGQPLFVTASHCTSTLWLREYSTQYQGGSYVGTEWRDPNAPACGSSKWCRESDASMIALDPSVSYTFQIARPASYNNEGWGGGYGTIEIDQTNPPFDVTGTERTVVVGQQLQKVGSTTGWTWGYVQRTCVTVNHPSKPANYLARCQHFSDIYAQGGDSGSPVFAWGGASPVTLYGTEWAIDNYALQMIHSGYRSMEGDFGILDAGLLQTH